jgi:hypothetical protein
MFNNAIFCLNGIGYLHDVIHASNQVIARINVINKFNSNDEHTPQDIWIDCSTKEDRLIRLLNNLQCSLSKQKTIILGFSAAYSGISNEITGTDTDLSHAELSLEGILQDISKLYIDGISHPLSLTSLRLVS